MGTILQDAARPAPLSAWGALMPAVLVCVLGVAGLAAGRLATADSGGRFMVLGASAATIVHLAGGGVVAMGAVPQVAVGISDDPEFAAAMRSSGAWLVFPAPGGLGCTTETGNAL